VLWLAYDENQNYLPLPIGYGERNNGMGNDYKMERKDKMI
jgi:hypothetical protein